MSTSTRWLVKSLYWGSPEDKPYWRCNALALPLVPRTGLHFATDMLGPKRVKLPDFATTTRLTFVFFKNLQNHLYSPLLEQCVRYHGSYITSQPDRARYYLWAILLNTRLYLTLHTRCDRNWGDRMGHAMKVRLSQRYVGITYDTLCY